LGGNDVDGVLESGGVKHAERELLLMLLLMMMLLLQKYRQHLLATWPPLRIYIYSLRAMQLQVPARNVTKTHGMKRDDVHKHWRGARHVPRNVMRLFRDEEDENEVVAKEKKTGNAEVFSPAAYEAGVRFGAAHVIQT
jgi:hypothetical protein